MSTGAERRSATTRSIAALVVGSLAIVACGGDDDDDADSSTTTSTVASAAPTTTVVRATTTTAAPTTTTTLALVTEGATVVVANASGINGAAGRMTDQLAVAGFTTGDATNSTESQLEVTKIYYDPENTNAMAVADSLRAALGGGDISVEELTVPAPVESGDVGEASVLVAMGNDTADKTLAELQGLVAPETTAPADDEATDDETTDDETTDDETTDDETTDG